jgi:hypothetical protein
VKIAFQIGYKKALGKSREGQLVQVSINDQEISFDEKCGKYLTSMLDARRRGFLWFLYKAEVDSSDIIRLVVKTVSGGVPDEKRTFESFYSINEDSPVRTISISGVGHSKYPLLKGRVMEISSFSKEDERAASIEDFLDDEEM